MEMCYGNVLMQDENIDVPRLVMHEETRCVAMYPRSASCPNASRCQ